METTLCEKLSSFSPLVVGIGPCVTPQLRALKKISSACAKVFADIPVFAGGPFASIEGQEWVFNEVLGINYLVKGDNIIKYNCIDNAFFLGFYEFLDEAEELVERLCFSIWEQLQLQ